MAEITLGQATANTLNFTILHTNDEHAAMVPSPLSDYGLEDGKTDGGIARVATLITQIRNQKLHPVNLYWLFLQVTLSVGHLLAGSIFRTKHPNLL